MSKYCMGCMEQYGEEYEICPYCGYIEGTKPEQALHMEPGSILAERYIVGKSIGYGGFGVTYIGWDALLEHKVAIKEYLPSEFSTRMPGVTQVTVYNGDKSEQFRDGLRQFVEEAKKLAKFNSIEGIVKVYDSFEENNTAYIVMEYLQGETLAQRLERDKTIEPEEAVAMLLPVIESLQQVHEQGIVHRDLAPDNLFITEDGSVKVIDFGAARFATTSHSRSLTVIIKPGFSPEEQYRSHKKQDSYTDVYAIAAVLYKAITGITPPDALERYAHAESKNKDTLEPISKYYKKIDENTENAILNAMNIRIEDRTQTMAALKEELTSEDPVVRVYGRIKRIDTLRWPLWAKITVPVVASLVLVFGILFATGVIGFKSNLQIEIKIPEGMTRVPSVVNQTTQLAENRLTEAVLLYTVVGKEYSALVPADYVLTQDLTGGIIVMQNSILNITVSGGAEKKAVPYVANLSLEEAQALLEESGFVLSKIEEYSVAIETGYVISQSEIAGEELAIGSVITLVVSKGADPSIQMEEQEFQLPDLCGKSYEEVLAIAEQYGFKLTISDRRYSNDYTANQIMEQAPAAGGMLVTGATVEVVISMGRQTVKIADVQYQTEQNAKTMLQAQGLNVTTEAIESETVAAGLVITQTPAAGTVAEPGATVHLIISKGAETFDMPKVTGMTEADAKANLTSKGLSVSVTYEYSTQAAGTVLKQSIAPNTKVTRGTAVTITVSSGEETVKVPNVTGQTLETAENSLKSAGFKVTVNKIYSDTVPENQVINQNPASGSAQVKGSTVVITVSLGKDNITGIQLASYPNKTTYFVGETLNPAGLTLTASYRSGKTETIATGFSCSPTTLSTQGTQTITVTYEGKTTTFTVTVEGLITIYFETNGGFCAEKYRTVPKNASIGTLPTSTKDHFGFDGWFLADGTAVNENTVFSTGEEITLYAHWNPIPYTVSWNTGTGYSITVSRTSSPNAGAAKGTINNGDKVYYGDVLSVSYAANTGYTLTEQGSTTITVSGNVTSSGIFASVKVNSYTVSWNTGTGYSISVSRTSSPNAGAATETLSNGSTVYYGDILSVSYSAATGYSLSDKGQTSIAVGANVGSSQIYASASPNSYTYNIVYTSSNGTPLGSSAATYKYGTTNTISAPGKSGYNTPPAQSVNWDSTSAKTITFTYTPTDVSNSTKSGTLCTAPNMWYSATVSYRNRTATSVQLCVMWTTSIKAYGYNSYGQRFQASVGSVGTGDVVLSSYGTWKNSSSSERSVTCTSSWITVPLNTTDATSVTMGIYYYQVNSNGTDMTKYYGEAGLNLSWTIYLPAY